jgi:hypothetical protein
MNNRVKKVQLFGWLFITMTQLHLHNNNSFLDKTASFSCLNQIMVSHEINFPIFEHDKSNCSVDSSYLGKRFAIISHSFLFFLRFSLLTNRKEDLVLNWISQKTSKIRRSFIRKEGHDTWGTIEIVRKSLVRNRGTDLCYTYQRSKGISQERIKILFTNRNRIKDSCLQDKKWTSSHSFSFFSRSSWLDVREGIIDFMLR